MGGQVVLLLILVVSLQVGTVTASDGTAPALPQGLELPGIEDEPRLPSGLEDAEPQHAEETTDDRPGRLTFGEITGFAELRGGGRLYNDGHEKQKSILESRLQLRWVNYGRYVDSRITLDLLYDDLLDGHEIRLESGLGWLDLREAHLLLRPLSRIDIKLGRQVLTWGTGDLIFINDLFPKDWNSFFTGRDNEYLKAPSDALKISWFGEPFNIDLIYTPRFDADRFIDGSRISYFDARKERFAGRDEAFPVIERDSWFRDAEWALRLYRHWGSVEAAFYGYQGYWKSPAGVDSRTGGYIFPRLRTAGASLRTPLFKGVASLEMGYYDSRDDRTGSNPFIRNSEFRLLGSYEQELVRDLTGAVQFYWEQLQDYTRYLRSSQSTPARDRNRLVWTLRLTRLLFQQNLRLSLFNYYSPTDKDGYSRINGSYKMSDQWQVESGLNLFYGQQESTFFGQFEKNSNLYFSLRFSF